jgi:chromosome segregation ATPase
MVLRKQKSSYKMSRNKKDQENINESDNESDGESASNDKAGTKDYGANNHTTRGGNSKRQLESGTNSHSGTNFASFDTTVRETVRQLSATQEAIDYLQGEYKRHANDIQEAIHNRETVAELQAQIHKHEITIETLQNIRSQSKQELEKEKELLTRDKEKLSRDKKTEEKRIRASDAERKIREDQEITKRKEELEKAFRQRTKKVEQEMEKREADYSKRALYLEAAKNNLSERLTTQDKKIRKQDEELVEAAGKIEDLERLKSSLKTEVQNLKKDLAKVRNEFALNHETVEF